MNAKFKPTVALQIRLPIELREKLENVKAETGKSVNEIIIELVKNLEEKTA
jgi:predicted DNA-binding protein